MYSHGQESFRTNNTKSERFFNSCMGRIVILLGIFIGVLILALISKPSKAEMYIMINDGIHTCIVQNDSSKQDGVDDVTRNFGAIFATPSVTPDSPSMKEFYQYNRIEIYEHTFFSSAYIFNNAKPSGVRVGIGLFGLVIPTVGYSDYVSRLGPIHKGYNKKLIHNDWTEINRETDNGLGTLDGQHEDEELESTDE